MQYDARVNLTHYCKLRQHARRAIDIGSDVHYHDRRAYEGREETR